MTRRLTAEDFWNRVDRSGGPDACWPYLGPLVANCDGAGYGTFGKALTGQTRAHRVAWVLTYGPGSLDDEAYVLDHVCHTRDLTCKGGRGCPHRRCCNPAHLEQVSQAENSRRNAGHGSRRGPVRRSECVKGHDLDAPDAVYVKPSGARECRQCKEDRWYRNSPYRKPDEPRYRHRHAYKPVCPRGHDLTDPSNVYLQMTKEGWVGRSCKTCKRERYEALRASTAPTS